MNKNIEASYIRILIYSDLNSPFARDWVNLVASVEGIELLAVCSTTKKTIRPDDFPYSSEHAHKSTGRGWLLRKLATRIRRMGLSLKSSSKLDFLINKYKIFNLAKDVSYLKSHIESFKPDIIHGMRIPFEGVTVARCRSDKPVILSIWGNDLTLFANAGGEQERQIKFAISVASAIHADAKRDIDSCWDKYQFDKGKPFFIAPASGGVNSDNIRLDISKSQAKIALGFDPDTILVCNPRGLRSYVDTGLFIQACEEVLERVPHVKFIAVGVGDSIKGWKHSANAKNNNSRLITTESLNIARFRLLIRAIDVYVSPTYHDGVPISLLESMGSGVFPVLSEIDSISDFIRSDSQGRMFKIGEPQVLRDLLIDVLQNTNFEEASLENERIISEVYSVDSCKEKIESFYKKTLSYSSCRSANLNG